MICIRKIKPHEHSSVNSVAMDAFEEFKADFSEWDQVSKRLRGFAANYSNHTISVADKDGEIVGAVAYTSGIAARPDHFPKGCPIISVLAVKPSYRGQGIGSRLLEVCLSKAKKEDECQIILHTTKQMSAALTLYKRYGFSKYGSPYMRNGLYYQQYVKKLSDKRA